MTLFLLCINLLTHLPQNWSSSPQVAYISVQNVSDLFIGFADVCAIFRNDRDYNSPAMHIVRLLVLQIC